tara:strand:- start:225 stop:563 length:339 start_codon:yes stop_codon:yes gene_type:complete
MLTSITKEEGNKIFVETIFSQEDINEIEQQAITILLRKSKILGLEGPIKNWDERVIKFANNMDVRFELEIYFFLEDEVRNMKGDELDYRPMLEEKRASLMKLDSLIEKLEIF